MKSLGAAQKSAEKTIDLTALNQSISLFNVQEGRYPKTLQELVPDYIGQIPDVPAGYKITYDANTGIAKLVQQP